MRHHFFVAGALAAAALPIHVLAAQDGNIAMPAARVEAYLRDSALKPVASQGSRFKGDRTEHVLLSFNDTTAIEVKWAIAPTGGEAFNNQPRYEAAAYELQKLFLDERDYVVPPTVLRMVPQSVFAASAGLKGEPTFERFAGRAGGTTVLDDGGDTRGGLRPEARRSRLGLRASSSAI